MPHAALFIVAFQVNVNYFILKSNYNEFDEKPFFEVTRNWLNFRLRSFLYEAAVFYKLASYMWVLTVISLQFPICQTCRHMDEHCCSFSQINLRSSTYLQGEHSDL